MVDLTSGLSTKRRAELESFGGRASKLFPKELIRLSNSIRKTTENYPSCNYTLSQGLYNKEDSKWTRLSVPEIHDKMFHFQFRKVPLDLLYNNHLVIQTIFKTFMHFPIQHKINLHNCRLGFDLQFFYLQLFGSQKSLNTHRISPFWLFWFSLMFLLCLYLDFLLAKTSWRLTHINLLEEGIQPASCIVKGKWSVPRPISGGRRPLQSEAILGNTIFTVSW